ncbi:MAG: glycosyltransferase family 4 protein [bacterium]
MKKLVLFDTVTTGHHVSYAEFIIRYLEKNTTMQWDFVTDTCSPYLRKLLLLFPRSILDWRSIGRHPIINRIYFSRRISRIFQIMNCIDYSIASQANLIHFLSIDHMEIPLFLNLLICHCKLQGISCKIICTVHKEKPKRSRLGRNVARRMLRYMAARGWIDIVFVHVSAAAKDLRAKGVIISQIPYPIDNEIMKSALPFSKKELCDRLGMPITNKPICLLFGSIRPIKGVTYLLQALEHIKIPCLILIAGKLSPSLGIDLLERSRAFQSENVELRVVTEYITNEDIPLYYALADLILMPYTHDSPGAGGPLLLASAARKPVIASDLGELGRKVRAYNLGILCEPESVSALANSLNKALSQIEMLKNNILEGAERCANRHSWHNMARQVYQSYELIIQSI